MFWRLKSKVILLIILETIDFIVKSIFIVCVCKIGGYVLNYLCSILIYMYFFGGVYGKIIQILFDYCSKYVFLSWF